MNLQLVLQNLQRLGNGPTKKKIVKIKINYDEKLFYFPSKDITDLTKQQVLQFMDQHTECTWASFDEFASNEESIYCVKLNYNTWKLSQCSCPYYLKHLFVSTLLV